jgi:hypothetical protein
MTTSRRALCTLFPISLLIFFVAFSQVAQAHISSVTVPCTGPITPPEGNLRAASDGDTYEYIIVPGDHTEIYDQHWTFNGLSPNNPNIAPE